LADAIQGFETHRRWAHLHWKAGFGRRLSSWIRMLTKW
jgi:hypothetical protein